MASTTTLDHLLNHHNDDDTFHVLSTTPPRNGFTFSLDHNGLKLLRPGKLIVAAFPDFYPVCYASSRSQAKQHDSSSSSPSSTSSIIVTIPSTDRDDSTSELTHPQFAGLEVDLILRFCAQQGLQPEIFAAPSFEGIWNYPTRFLADVCIGGITAAPSRDHVGLAWSEAYYTVTRTLIYHRRNPPKAGLPFPHAVDGIVRGVPGSTGFADAEARLCASGKRHLLQESTDDEGDIQALLRGDIQGVMRGSAIGRAIVRRYPTDLAMMEAWEILPELRPTPQGEVFCFPVRTESGLAGRLTEFVARERATGSFGRLLQKHGLA